MNRKNETDFWQKQADEGSLLVAVHEGVPQIRMFLR
jgi:hypothetical protein